MDAASYHVASAEPHNLKRPMALKDNPEPIRLDLDYDDEDYDPDRVVQGTIALAEARKIISDSQVAVTKAETMERNMAALEQANQITRWNWDGDAEA